MTGTASSRARTPAPAVRPVQLVMTIDRTPYTVRPLVPDAPVARRAFRLVKPDGTLYDVAQTRWGLECDCPDFIFRRDGLDPAGCKHVRALVACGLIEPSEEPRRG